MKPGTWLDDEIINFYGSLMQKRSDAGEDGMPRIHYFNSFFYGKMAEKGYNKLLARWTKKVSPGVGIGLFTKKIQYREKALRKE